jgi:ABC-type amino acid transport substrate-binding protein
VVPIKGWDERIPALLRGDGDVIVGLTETEGVLKGTSWAQAAADAGVSPTRIESFDKLDPLLEALKTGKVGATVMSVSDFTLAAKRHPGLRAGVFLGPGHECLYREPEENFFLEPIDHQVFGEEALSVLGRARGQ